MAKFVNREIPEGLTFDDVLLVPAHSDVLPRDVDVTTTFTTDIKLHTPIVSAAMDTVTEADLAIAMARAGGIGVIHKNMTIEQQCEQVRHVKRAENGMIYDPVTISPDANVGNALAMMKKHHIGGIPVVDANGFLIGIVTNRDLRFQEDMQLPISEVMTKENLVTAPKGITLADATKILQHSKVEKLPVVDNDGKLVGLITYKDLMKIKDNPIASKDSKGRLLVAAAAGIKSDTLDRIGLLIDAGADAVVLDTAHGHSEGVLRMIKKACDAYKDFQIIAGNVATAAGAKALADAGVKAVKVGIGPGSICTTRIVAGVGVPQITAISNVAEALQGTDVPCIADGGIRFSGDIAKAIAAGASSVMMGGMFAGTEEDPGEVILYQGRSYKSYRGMGSLGAMGKGSADRYFQDNNQGNLDKFVPEGIEGMVPYKGGISAIIYQMIGGLRSSMGYCGCRTIEEMRTRASFVQITAGGLRESHVHDVKITKEAPNYRQAN